MNHSLQSREEMRGFEGWETVLPPWHRAQELDFLSLALCFYPSTKAQKRSYVVQVRHRGGLLGNDRQKSRKSSQGLFPSWNPWNLTRAPRSLLGRPPLLISFFNNLGAGCTLEWENFSPAPVLLSVPRGPHMGLVLQGEQSSRHCSHPQVKNRSSGGSKSIPSAVCSNSCLSPVSENLIWGRKMPIIW